MSKASILQRVTTQCGAHGHPEISLRCDGSIVPEEDLDWFARNLEEMVAGGEKFKAGDTIKIGWIMARFKAADGLLALEEPDFKSFPIVWIDGITRTLADLRRQKDVVESLEGDMEPIFPAVDEAGCVCDRYTGGRPLVIQRDPPQDSFSGWSVTCDDPEHDHALEKLTPESLYRIALDMPAVVQFLALPPGLAGHICADEMEFITADGLLEIKPGSYLDRLLASQRGRG